MRALEQVLLANTLADWLSALGIAIGAFAAFWILKRSVIRRFAVYAQTTPTRVDDFLAAAFAATRLLLLAPLALFAAVQVLTLPVRAEHAVSQLTVIALLLQSAIWGHHFIASWMRHTLRVKRAEDAASASTAAVLGFLARLGLWSLALLLALDNLGFNITALLTGLGIGGVAVALAAQNILGDLFASLSIVLDRPFVVGDFIVVGDQLGTVEYIGLKTTRVRSLSGEQIVFSNTDLLKSRIRNYKRMHERRVPFTFGVVYQTPPDQLAAIPQLVRTCVEAQANTRFDRAHFKEYGDSALVFEAVYFVLDADYNVYMDIHQAVLLELFRRLREHGIEFAYPTRTLHVSQVTPGPASNPGGNP
ncbi:MAG TPA: mechanosensitive ion channel family protein [Acidiferrobacterales bacterium]|nr:mechanosensitive ion channel family protein [Acidiferrobacterales bacterium]